MEQRFNNIDSLLQRPQPTENVTESIQNMRYNVAVTNIPAKSNWRRAMDEEKMSD
jgi:hypothetical protein